VLHRTKSGLALGGGLLALTLAFSPGCKPGGAAATVAPDVEYDPADQTKCGVKKSSERPLIVEWPSADRAALETQKRKGLVVVRYEGCEMQVLRQCKAAGEYQFLGVEAKNETVSIRNADELYARMPVYAARFEARLERAGVLNVAMTIVGNYEASTLPTDTSGLEGRCEGATHVVSALTAGAFEFFAGSSAGVGGELSVGNAGGGASSTTSRETLTRDGAVDACVEARRDSAEPPHGCGALLRVEVVPLLANAAGGSPGAVASTVPPPSPTRRPDSAPTDDRAIRKARAGAIMGYVSGGAALALGITAGMLTDTSFEGSIGAGAGALAIAGIGIPVSWGLTRGARGKDRDIGVYGLRAGGWVSYALALASGVATIGVGAAQIEPPSALTFSIAGLGAASGALMGTDGVLSAREIRKGGTTAARVRPVVVPIPHGTTLGVGGRF